jgi:hypothetical protein
VYCGVEVLNTGPIVGECACQDGVGPVHVQSLWYQWHACV